MLTLRAAAKWLSFARQPLVLALFFGAGSAPAGVTTNTVELITVQGTVEVARAGQSVWDLASAQRPYCVLNPGDQIRTKERSRATIQLSDLTLVKVGPNAHLVLLRPADRRPGFSLPRGLLHLFHRDQPGEYYFRTPTASPVIRGTEFVLAVAEDGATTLQLLEGEVALTNDFGALDLKSGQAALVQPARAPTRIAALRAVNVIQWCLYYPAVLHLPELRLSAEEQTTLSESLAAYRQGDLLAAMANYPPDRRAVSDQEKVYLAALLLAVGEVGEAAALMKSLGGADERALRLATALQTLIAAVKLQPLPAKAGGAANETLASSLLAESYHHQSRFELEAALAAARAAVERAPDFAFGWARVAELELSFGRTRRAGTAAARALELAPLQAQAMTVKGFLLAAQNRIALALAQFEEAIATDGALGNAWLGRGLCRIRQGYSSEGAADLLVAAAQEPNRALLRSYLGKAFDENGDLTRAVRELEHAKQLDPNDPTAWLYSALLNQQRNRVNEAVRDLEGSQALNDHRQLYRSRLLLDQDRAVRQANLASVYQDAGLFDQSVREASRAVSSDYANPSAHLFLANSYAQLGDVPSVNLRYETATLSEYLVAQLLAPVGGSALSPYVSQQEYSRLFQRDGFNLSSGTEYRSTGDWRQRGVQYGAFGNFDYALDAYYATQNGQRPNNDLELLTLSAATRFQLTPQDTVFVQAVSTEFESGDVRQYYDQTTADPYLRIEESQQPNLFAGYHHDWSPGSHTLLLLGWLRDDFRLHGQSNHIPTLTFYQGEIVGQEWFSTSEFNQMRHSEFSALSTEVQQIQRIANHTLIVGGRYQYGETDSEIHLEPTSNLLAFPPGAQDVDTHLRRASFYLYDQWQVWPSLALLGGVSYDALDFPANIDSPPITDAQTTREQWSPKAGLLWQPTPNSAVRGAFTRSLGGLYFDQSVRLEPAQVAGFNQALRSAAPEAVAGLLAGAEFTTAGLDFSWRLPTGTYLGVGGEWLRSEGDRTVGMFAAEFFGVSPSETPQQVDYEEATLSASLNQLLGRDWSAGVRYRVSDAELRQQWVNVPDGIYGARGEDAGVLQQLELAARYTPPCGFFAEAQGVWNAQHSRHQENLTLPEPSVPDEEFWQLNLFVGYRFARRRAEVLVGGLNLTGADYRINPINLHADWPRERTLLVRFQFNF